MISNRKDDHVQFAVEQQHSPAGPSDFDQVNFLHHALAGIDEIEVSSSVEVAGKPWSTPLYINGMTGGSAPTGEINRQLGIAAAETGVAIASGSMSAYLRDPALAETYRVLRSENPHGFVMANVNANATVDHAHRAVDLLEANALQIHLNAVQEIVMPEGDRAFDGWRRQIEKITVALEVPVIVKEVGFGLGRRTILELREVGVAVADVGGRGGTNFARIENARRATHDNGLPDYYFLESWGQSTAACLIDAAGIDGIGVAASGGIRTPLDVLRSLALGACATGIAGRALACLSDQGIEALIDMIRQWVSQMRQIQTVLGAATPPELVNCDLLITGELAEFARLRDVDPARFARRSRSEAII